MLTYTPSKFRFTVALAGFIVSTAAHIELFTPNQDLRSLIMLAIGYLMTTTPTCLPHKTYTIGDWVELNLIWVFVACVILAAFHTEPFMVVAISATTLLIQLITLYIYYGGYRVLATMYGIFFIRG